MDIRRLEIFCAVVEHKGFSRAADAIHLSQPSVSEHIRALEENLGEKLLDRLGREVLPTPAGQILYHFARRIIRLRDEAVQAIETRKGFLSGPLTVGGSTIPGAYVLPMLVHAFRQIHPQIQVSLKISGSARIAEGILHGEIELGIIGARLTDNHLECHEIFSDELVLAVHSGHPWAERESISATELADHPFLLRERGSGTRQVMTEALKTLGLDLSSLTVVGEMGSTEAIRQGIKSRLGASILSLRSVSEDLEHGSLVRVPIRELSMIRPFFLTRRKNRQPTPLAQAFFDFLQARYREEAEG